ncbi:MAG: hypothetical protein FVQ84_00355 [Planctomycetes bacterium]|nr:hypothetical protein [Planctomycetota bacterium]
MNRVIYFIEDQEALTPYILLARHEDRFPGCRILAADSIDDAIKWCNEYDGEVLFVVDSRMSSELLPKYLEKALEDSGDKIQDLSGLVSNEYLTGMLGTVVLKNLKPNCRTILLTAFSKTISEIRQSHPLLNGMLEDSIDVSLSKASPEALTEAIQTQLMELSRARRQRPSE